MALRSVARISDTHDYVACLPRTKGRVACVEQSLWDIEAPHA